MLDTDTLAALIRLGTMTLDFQVYCAAHGGEGGVKRAVEHMLASIETASLMAGMEPARLYGDPEKKAEPWRIINEEL